MTARIRLPDAVAFWRRPAHRGSATMIASTAFSIGTKAFQAIASFATVHKLVQLWGLSGYGLWVTLTAFALYISLFDMGVGYGVKNRVSEAWGRGNLAEASDSVRVGVAVYFVASLAALVGGAFLILLVAPFKDHVLAAAILWCTGVVAFFLSFHGIVLQGLARFKTPGDREPGRALHLVYCAAGLAARRRAAHRGGQRHLLGRDPVAGRRDGGRLDAHAALRHRVVVPDEAARVQAARAHRRAVSRAATGDVRVERHGRPSWSTGRWAARRRRNTMRPTRCSRSSRSRSRP